MIDKLFDFKIFNNMRIYCNNNDIYSHLLLYLNDNNGDILVVTSTEAEANTIYNYVTNVYKNTFLFLEDDYLSKKSLATSPEFKYDRINFLNKVGFKSKKIIICNLLGYVKKIPNVKDFKSNKITLSINSKFNREELINNLDKIGYKRENVVTEIGEYAVRGFVIDIFPFHFDKPIRIELFDDEIEKIKYFDIETQITDEYLDKATIFPIKEEISSLDSTIIDYLDNPIVVFQDESQLNLIQKNINNQKKYYDDTELIDYKTIKNNNRIFINTIDNINQDVSFNVKNLHDEINSLTKLEEFLLNNKNNYIFTNNSKKINLINKNYKDVNEKLISSFSYKDINYISYNEVIGIEENKNYKSQIKLGKKISSLDNLQIGDYIVHKDHGIGIYNGIKTITKNGILKDYILLNYKGTDKLYIPVENISKLYKYTSKEGASPTLNKLNSREWEKTKYKIRNKIKDISAALLNIYKKRNSIKIEKFNETYPEEEVFASEFPYIETPDQIKAIKEITKDLETNKPMERLLCGDVGYGKTEVIFRAIFKTIMNNKQVCYLCPTTVLAKQQYNSALKRFSNHAVRIKLLTRHTKLSEVHEIEKDLKEGKIDIIFGTHKLLNPSIKYKNIGLLVIDEEHKFGVEHKEKIKEIFTNVHVLSVSATPIPRSLQMSLVGIRDMSLIETAPNNRYPVQTYVIKQDFFLITSAIEKEISRKGQVFILINNISKLEEWKKKLQNKFPNLIIEFIHGQLENDKSSEIMDAFANKKIDILITTTIIENGIDIPNANTIIVIDADNFGLSQLYQIRGRVGRSDKIAYAYLMYDDKKLLNDAAKKRLKAIKEFTTLGSGYKISMRDLSIRGAGDLLGKEQAGFIDSVGVDMYLELINEELENKEEESVETNKISLNAVDTHISKKYTSEDEMLIELHEQISNIKSKKDYKIVYEEILDKYGFIDSKMEIYLKQSLLENLIQKYKIKLLNNTNYVITLSIPKEVYEKTKVEELFLKILNVSIKFNFKYQNNNIILSLNKLGLEKNYVDYLLDFCEIVEEEMK